MRILFGRKSYMNVGMLVTQLGVLLQYCNSLGCSTLLQVSIDVSKVTELTGKKGELGILRCQMKRYVEIKP